MASASPLIPPAPRLLDRLSLVGIGAAGLLTALLLWRLSGDPLVGAGFVAALVLATAVALVVARARAPERDGARESDWSLTQAAIEAADQAIAVTDRSGRLVCANHAFEQWFGGLPVPSAITFADDGGERLSAAGRGAWRDGSARATALALGHSTHDLEVARAGLYEDHLVWRFRRQTDTDLIDRVRLLLTGAAGRLLGLSGVMMALVDPDGRLLTSNPVFAERALGDAATDVTGRDFVALLRAGEDDRLRLVREDSDEALPLRLVQVPMGADPSAPTLFLILDEEPARTAGPLSSTAAVHVHGLLAMLPLGLALAERDGRVLFMNAAFERAAGIAAGQSLVYPSDIVVREDKGAVADAIRRMASGRGHSGDLSVRLAGRPDESISLTITAARGLGDAAVMLTLKDNSEESRLKKQVAQATKMQAVGQLAGGVAHDFNNILTAIIGHCDLMMLRHTPGDSDYDDIQQIKHNSNRAAALTRQLLAFSRQQTLRPEILQLPDVISEISALLKRLLGETVKLEVKHGRGLGAVRADPGQLEQVIVNLAVNARDAMPGGGTVTVQTYAVSAAKVREIGSEVLPVGDYTALSVADTGVGIPADVLPKVFEPFFTTKEVGKGTGLGLSTVYGIVKQTGGFIFADSKPGEGTSFVIYLPVHRADPKLEAPVARPKEKPVELWGSGTVLIVEDEAMVRTVAERALTRQGYKVLTAENGERALEVLETVASNETAGIDLLISDVVMPTMDGPTLVRHARARFPDLPILFMSGYAEEQLRRSIDIERVHFIAKPFSVQQLAEAARDTLRPAAGADESRARAG